MAGERVKLTRSQSIALGIYGRIEGRNYLYWGSPKSSRELAVMGLVEAFAPPSVSERSRMKKRPYRITAAGRALLSGDRP